MFLKFDYNVPRDMDEAPKTGHWYEVLSIPFTYRSIMLVSTFKGEKNYIVMRGGKDVGTYISYEDFIRDYKIVQDITERVHINIVE